MFNNFSLSNQEIDKILLDFENRIREASIVDGKYDDECAQAIRLAIYRKLSKNRNVNKNKKIWKIFKNFGLLICTDDIYLVEGQK